MTIQVLNGVRNWYGPRGAEDKLPGLVKTEGYEKTLVWDYNYDDLPAESNDGSMSLVIPADSFITSARIHVKTAAAGSVAVYNYGLYEGDGSVIDLDGIDAVVAQATLAEDAWIDCDGALVGASVGAADAHLRIVLASGSHTAGSYRMIINYIQPLS